MIPYVWLVDHYIFRRTSTIFEFDLRYLSSDNAVMMLVLYASIIPVLIPTAIILSIPLVPVYYIRSWNYLIST